MSVIQFLDNLISNKKDIRSYQSDVFLLHETVVKQAIDHTTRSEMSRLFNIARPYEEKVYTDWRIKNKRNLTATFTIQFQRMMQRILSQTLNVELTVEKERLVFNELIPLSISDPNALVVTFPYMKEDEDKAPSSGEFQENMALEKKQIIVYSFHILEYKKGEYLIWYKDNVDLGKGNIQPRYYAVDRENYYIIEPTLTTNSKINYTPIVWYNHALGILPSIAELPAINITHKELDKKTNKIKVIKYKESVCWSAFEAFDEGIVRFSSEQVASYMHANPKLVITKEIDCPSCGGGRFQLDEENNPTKTLCRTCNGMGNLQQFGDFSTINLRDNGLPGSGSTTNPVYYLNPPSGIKELQDSFMLFFDMGEKSLCNDILEGTPNESGVAKEMRLEPKQDLMKSYGQQVCYMIEDILNAELLLDNAKEDQLIVITPPVYYQTKSPELLELQLKDSLQGERFMRWMDLVKTKYRGDEPKIKLYKYVALYAPLTLYKDTEIDSAYNQGSYDERDLIRRDYAFFALENVFEKEPDLEDFKVIKQNADTFLTEQGILKPEVEEMPTFAPTDPNVNPQNPTNINELPQQLNDLEEVLTALVRGEIQRDIAVKYIMVIEQVDEAGANEIIDGLENI